MPDGPLDGLDAVTWSQLHHAYGPATDVPEQLRTLQRPNQGTRWQASHMVVPFLVGLINDPVTPDRADLLGLLTAIAIGDRRDDDLPFDPDRAFAAAADPADLDTHGLIRRFYAEDDLTDDELTLTDTEAIRWGADSYASTGAV